MMFVMLLFQTVLTAMTQIWANKVRALLTTLGIVIGVTAVVATVAAVQGLETSILSEFETFGTKKVYIDGRTPRKLRGRIPRWKVELKMHEVHAVVKNATTLARFTPLIFMGFDVEFEDQKVTGVQVMGIWPAWHDIEARSVLSGRPFNSVDEEQQLSVCLVNDKAIEILGLNKEPAGTAIRLGGRRFNIVGVVETKTVGPMFGGGDTQAEVFIPASVALNLQPTRKWVNFLLAELKTPDMAEEAKAEVGSILRRIRQLEPGEEDTFDVAVLQSFIDQFKKVSRIITFGSVGVVAISLLVGGIGIMNIMLVSVSERTREIGLRKALGARPEVILVQFLIEAVTLCMFGGFIGLALGWSIIQVAKAAAPDMLKFAAIPLWAAVLAVGAAAITGIIAGMFPAIKAARLNPIDALRHE